MEEEKSEQRSEQQEQAKPEQAAEEAGRKGGVASMAAEMPRAREAAGAVAWTRNLVRWGPIWAGLLLALGIQIILGAVGLAVALSFYDVASPDYARSVANLANMWSVISGLMALFLGGFVSGRMASVQGLRSGVIQGTMVWTLALIVGVILSSLGIAGLLNAVNVMPFLRTLMMTSPEQQNLIQNAVTETWWFVIGSLLGWIAAVIGGMRGAAAHPEEAEV